MKVWGVRNRRVGRGKGKISQAMFDLITRTAIIFLCLYISFHCLTAIFGKNMEKHMIKVTGDFTKQIVGICAGKKSDVLEIVEGFTDENKRVEDKIKENLFNPQVMEYVREVKVENERDKLDKKLVSQMKQENDKARSHDKNSQNNKQQETTAVSKDKKDEKKKTKEVMATKIIVPKPEITGTKYNLNNLKSFDDTIEKFYIVTSATSIKESDMRLEKALNMNFKIKGSNKKPQILIYHTHSQEGFTDSDNNPEKSIVAVGTYLAKILKEQFGYNVIHDKSTYDIVNGKLDRNSAYDQARKGVAKILKENPSISLVLDIHRDGVSDDVHLVTKVNGKKTAQIMFFNGMARFKDSGDIDYLYNPYLKQNLALSLQMKLNGEAYYPGFTRRNYLNAYTYNLDMCEQCMLIEMGGQTNTFNEVKNAAEPLAMLIYLTLGK